MTAVELRGYQDGAIRLSIDVTTTGGYTMRAVSRLSLIILGALLFAHCSSDSAPGIRVSNLRVDKANIQWKDAAGNTTNINDVLPGTMTAYQSVQTGPYTVSGTVQNEPSPAPVTFSAYTGGQYTVVVVDTGAMPSLRVVQ